MSADCKAQLLKLNHGLLFLFIELLSVLVEQPSQYAQSLMQVLATLQNMQHLVNLLRPHQVTASDTCIRLAGLTWCICTMQ